MSNNHVTKIYGAEIVHDFLGLSATATYGDESESFTSALNPRTGFSVEPSALQQAQAWAKEKFKAERAEREKTKRQLIEDSVAAAKAQQNKLAGEGSYT